MADEKPDDLQKARDGVGPLTQRDYWAVLRGCGRSAEEVMQLVRERFLDFPPEDLVVFRRHEARAAALEVGEKIEVVIRMMDPVAVRVIHTSEASLTLATLKGHPEAGRITFGAYPNDRGDVVFHIRSRARAGSAVDYAGFLVSGDPMQASTWTDYVDCVAHMVGDGVVGAIHMDEEEVEPNEDDESMDAPTFIAQGA